MSYIKKYIGRHWRNCA